MRLTTLRTGAEPKAYAAIHIVRDNTWIVVDLGIQKVMARCDEQADCDLITKALNERLRTGGHAG